MATTALPGPGPSVSDPHPPLSTRPTRLIGRFLLVLWAAFWLWFNIASAISETEGKWPHVAMAAATALLAAVSWFFPRVGGVLMIATGVAAAWFFQNPAAITLLAVPAAIIGVVLLFSEPRPRLTPQ